jgi:CRP-like cAMP-binding protein
MRIEPGDIDPMMLQYAQKYLAKFIPITMEQVKELLTYCEIRKFDKKAVIVHQGEVDNYLNLVITGMVRKYLRHGKHEHILQLATEGHVLQSEISFLTQTPSEVILEALEPTMLISLTYKNMELALDYFPQGEKLGRLIMTGMYIKKDENRYNRISKTPREIFFHYIENHPHMLQRVSQKYLASYLKIKPETFSRLKAIYHEKKKAERSS